MAKIVRTPTEATGGITADEQAKFAEHTKLWIRRAFRTDPIDPSCIIPAIEGIYAAAGLKKPRVIIVPSPLVMAFAYGAAAAIWHRSTHNATDDATANATRSATYNAMDRATYRATYRATRSATASATDNATYRATYRATYDATASATDDATANAMANGNDSERGAAEACFIMAGNLGIEYAKKWRDAYQGGNMWASYDCYLTGARDILGLRLPEDGPYSHWEAAAIHGGFRVMHPEFCMVSDFPEVLKIDDQNRPHCENGPSHRWRDGWSLYHWHGVAVPAHWIEDRGNLDPSEVLKAKNVEQRSAGAAIVGWTKMAQKLKRKIIDGDPNSDIGALVEMTLPGLSEPGRFLQAVCPRNGIICEGVPYISDIDGRPIETAIAAQAWRVGDPQSEYEHPPTRT